MPLTVIQGVVQNATKHPGEAGPCEWCGRPMTYRPNVPGCHWSVIPAALEPDQPRYVRCHDFDGSVYITRLCIECQGINFRLAKDGLKENPHEPLWPPASAEDHQGPSQDHS